MKFRRQLRAFAQAALHILAVVIPAVALARADTAVWRWAFAALTLAGVAQLVLAAFIYIPGFDPLFRIPWRGPRSRRRMAITFDDGPNGAATEVVLELLRRHGAKATFFMIGQNVDAEPELARRVVAEGHAVGSHTWSHVKLSTVSLAVAIDEIDRGHRSLRAAGIADAALFRAPHGHKRPGVVAHLTRNGLRMIAWTAGVYDTDSASGDTLSCRAMRWLRPGTILLLHDGKRGHDRGPMLQALDTILAAARARGLELVTIPELLAG